MREGMTDLVILIIALGIVLGIAFKAILPVMSETQMNYTEKLDDKSISMSFEDVGASTYTGELNVYEAMLMMQVQDEKMAEPRIVKVEGASNVITIDGTYKNVLYTATNVLWNDLKLRYGSDFNKMNSDGTFAHTYSFDYYFNVINVNGVPTLDERIELRQVR